METNTPVEPLPNDVEADAEKDGTPPAEVAHAVDAGEASLRVGVEVKDDGEREGRI
jgi:hypothetical protein